MGGEEVEEPHARAVAVGVGDHDGAEARLGGGLGVRVEGQERAIRGEERAEGRAEAEEGAAQVPVAVGDAVGRDGVVALVEVGQDVLPAILHRDGVGIAPPPLVVIAMDDEVGLRQILRQPDPREPFGEAVDPCAGLRAEVRVAGGEEDGAHQTHSLGGMAR